MGMHGGSYVIPVRRHNGFRLPSQNNIPLVICARSTEGVQDGGRRFAEQWRDRLPRAYCARWVGRQERSVHARSLQTHLYTAQLLQGRSMSFSPK
jgi:hypothetical protein